MGVVFGVTIKTMLTMETILFYESCLLLWRLWSKDRGIRWVKGPDQDGICFGVRIETILTMSLGEGGEGRK